MRLGWFLLLVANAACLRTTEFHCTSNSQCESPGQNGTCERSVGYCSFPDAACPDGRRFGELAGPDSNACVGEQPGLDAGVDAAPVAIGGTVTGLTGTGLVLRDNGSDPLAITANGMFTFATTLPKGTGYAVTVGTPPSGQDAYVGHATGTASGPVSSVVVSCYPAGSDPGVRCGEGIFCTTTESCCFDANSSTGTCGAMGSGCSKVAMPCDSAGECTGGGACCAMYHQGNQALQTVSCVATAAQCTGGNNEILCDPRDASPCQGSQTCTGMSRLGSAYHTCK